MHFLRYQTVTMNTCEKKKKINANFLFILFSKNIGNRLEIHFCRFKEKKKKKSTPPPYPFVFTN